jgi:hypothetical protein
MLKRRHDSSCISSKQHSCTCGHSDQRKWERNGVQIRLMGTGERNVGTRLQDYTRNNPKDLSIYLSLYGPLLGPGLFFSFVICFTESVGLLGRVISPSQGRYLHTGQHKHRTNGHKHSCLNWDSNPRSQYLSWRRLFMP